ncbi:hypothetical protein [Calidifontibacter indicus]|uniref:hypothetical protein n=1 Tax=Calidifontibacter indicus TaxID=419650 RepID=UPI003D753950
MTDSARVHVIHFDTDQDEMAKAWGPIQRAMTRYRVETALTSICPAPADWDGFVEAVTRSTADIVVPTLHGWDDGFIGPIDHDWSRVDQDVGIEDRDWRSIDEAFPAGSITAPTLLLFCCLQGHNQAAWRRAAPSSRLVLCDGIVRGVAHGLEHVVQSLLGESSPRKLQKKWHVTNP